MRLGGETIRGFWRGEAKIKKAEQMQPQVLEAQEYTETEDENMSEKLNNSVLYAGPEEM